MVRGRITTRVIIVRAIIARPKLPKNILDKIIRKFIMGFKKIRFQNSKIMPQPVL